MSKNLGPTSLLAFSMDRRQFSKVTVASLATAPALVAAQDRPVEGKHYSVLSSRQPTIDPKQVE